MSTDDAPTTDRKQVFNAALIVGVLFLLTKVLGLVRTIIFGAYYGTGTISAEAFAIVTPISDLVFQIIAGGGLASAFIPTFTTYFADEETKDEESGWLLFSAIINLVLVAVTIAAVLMAIFAAPLLRLLYGTLLATTPGLLEASVPLLRVILISTVIFGASGVVMAALNSRQHFSTPAWATVLYNIGIIAGIVVFRPNVIGFGYGAVIGSLAHLLIQLPALRNVGVRYSPILTLNLPDVRRVLWLMLPRVVGLSFSYLNPLVTPFIAQTMEKGSLGALLYANRIMLMPQGVLGQALGIASFPTFSTLAARQDYPGMRRILTDTLRLIIFLGLPIMAVLMILRQPLIVLAFQRGDFNANDTMLVTWGLFWYALALVALALIEVIVRAFYALQDTMTPVIAGGLQILVMFGLGMWFGRIVFPRAGLLGLGGVALGFSVANWLEVVVLLMLLSRKMQGIGGKQLLAGVWRMGLATVLMSIAMALVLRLIPASDALGTVLTQLILAGGLGSVVYLGVCYLLKLQELNLFLSRFKRRA